MRLNTRQIVIALAVSGAVVATTANAARDTIQIAGSSTVLPYASIVAEEFGNTFPQFKAPVVGSGGSSAGLKQFCQGLGDNTIDIANSSRKIKDAELAACKKAGVTQIQEIKIGYDGIVFASNLRKRSYELDAVQVFQALAAQLPSGQSGIAGSQRMKVFAHQPGAATFSESTGQPGQSKLHQVVPAGLRPPNRTARTYVGGSTAAEQYGSDARRARGHSAVQLGPEHHDPGPVPNLGRGTDVQLAHTAAAGGRGNARTRITDVSRT